MPNFTPIANGQRYISATSVDQHVALNLYGTALLVTNTGPYNCYVEFGATSTGFTTSSLTAMPVLANSAFLVERDLYGMSWAGAVCDNLQSCTVRFTAGFGS